MACTFQATIGGKFSPLIGLSDEDKDMDTMITTYNTAVTDAASEILGKERRRKKPRVTKDVLDLCDGRRDLKKKRYEAGGAKVYREANRRIQKAVKKAKGYWIGAQCEEIETCLNKNNSKRAFQLVKDLTSVGWLVGCFGFNGPLRQYFSLYRATSQTERKRREKIAESKNVQTTPTRTYCKHNRPLPYYHPNCRTPRHWKFPQDHRTTRPPL